MIKNIGRHWAELFYCLILFGTNESIASTHKMTVQGQITKATWYHLADACQKAGDTDSVVAALEGFVSKEKYTRCILHESTTKNGYGLHLNCDQAFDMFTSSRSYCRSLLKLPKEK